MEAYTQLRHDLACSEILQLPAGSAYVQQSHMVLLKGTLKIKVSPSLALNPGMPSLPCQGTGQIFRQSQYYIS